MNATALDVPSWQGIEVRHLLALAAVARTGSFSRAAEELGYTQSAVSQQVSSLERMVGTPMFDRPGGPRAIRITEAGSAMLAHADAVLCRLQAAEADLRSLATGECGTVRLGVFQSVGTRILPSLLRRFGTRHPGVEVVLRESHEQDNLLAWVEAGELDVTFCGNRPAGPFTRQVVLDDPWALIVPADSPEAERSSISPAEIVELPLIGYRSTCHDWLLERLPAAPRFVFRSDDNTTIQSCVGAGVGYAFVPLLTVQSDDPEIVIVPVEPTPPPRQLSLVWHADRRQPPPLTALIDEAAEVGAAIGADLEAVVSNRRSRRGRRGRNDRSGESVC